MKRRLAALVLFIAATVPGCRFVDVQVAGVTQISGSTANDYTNNLVLPCASPTATFDTDPGADLNGGGFNYTSAFSFPERI